MSPDVHEMLPRLFSPRSQKITPRCANVWTNCLIWTWLPILFVFLFGLGGNMRLQAGGYDMNFCFCWLWQHEHILLRWTTKLGPCCGQLVDPRKGLPSVWTNCFLSHAETNRHLGKIVPRSWNFWILKSEQSDLTGVEVVVKISSVLYTLLQQQNQPQPSPNYQLRGDEQCYTGPRALPWEFF